MDDFGRVDDAFARCVEDFVVGTTLFRTSGPLQINY